MRTWTINRTLAATAGALAFLALLAGDASPSPSDVDALTLAEWIRDRRAGLRVFDLRDPADFEQYHIPSARSTTIAEIERTEFQSNEIIVLYSDGGPEADAALSTLRSRGIQNAHLLRGGLYAWLDAVMHPALPDNASADQRRAFDHVRALSHYFGGQPSAFSAPLAPSTDQVIKRLRRRTC